MVSFLELDAQESLQARVRTENLLCIHFPSSSCSSASVVGISISLLLTFPLVHTERATEMVAQ